MIWTFLSLLNDQQQNPYLMVELAVTIDAVLQFARGYLQLGRIWTNSCFFQEFSHEGENER